MISAAELAKIQSDAVAVVCDKSCAIYHKTTTKDAYGTPVDSWSVLSATVMAGVTQPSAGLLQNYDYLIGDLAAYHIRMPVGTDVRHQDHLVIDGETLEVHVILDPQSYSVFENVIAAQIK